jgi:hypothetical protein
MRAFSAVLRMVSVAFAAHYSIVRLATTSADEAYLADPTVDMAPTFNAL